MTARRIGFIVVLAFVLGVSGVAGQYGVSNRYCCLGGGYSLPLDFSLKEMTARAETIFVGSVASVEPAVPVYPEGEKVDWEAYDKASDQFKAINVVTFAVDSVWKGKKVDTIKLRGDDLLLIYRITKKFLIFVDKDDTGTLRIRDVDHAFGFVDVNDPDYHWDIIDARGEKGWRLREGYGPYVTRFSPQNLWQAGDTAIWSSALRKEVTRELVALDPQFTNAKKTDEVFLISTRGCHFTKDEWDRPPINGVGYIGPRPCPLPLALVGAYVKVLDKTTNK